MSYRYLVCLSANIRSSNYEKVRIRTILFAQIFPAIRYYYYYYCYYCYYYYYYYYYSPFLPSDVSEKDLENFVYVAVWDWDRIGSNDFIGGMGLKVNDIITETCEGQRIECWYKLLADNISRRKSIRIISDEEAEKVIKLTSRS